MLCFCCVVGVGDASGSMPGRGRGRGRNGVLCHNHQSLAKSEFKPSHLNGHGLNFRAVLMIQSFEGHFKFVVFLLRCRGRGRVNVKVWSGSGSGTQRVFVSQPSVAKSEFFLKEICF